MSKNLFKQHFRSMTDQVHKSWSDSLWESTDKIPINPSNFWHVNCRCSPLDMIYGDAMISGQPKRSKIKASTIEEVEELI